MSAPAAVHRHRSDSHTSGDQLARLVDPGLADEFHCWPLPSYVWAALEQRYHSIFCSEPLLRLHGALTPYLEAWVLRMQGRIVALILFERHARVLRVINEVFDLTGEQLDGFAQAVFARYPRLSAIWLHAVALQGRAQRYPSSVVPVSDDYVLSLPSSEAAWLASLSAQTREKIRYQLRRTQRRQASLHFRTIPAAAIDDTQLRTVINFNRARMQAKGRRFGMDDQEQHRLCTLMHERGQLSVLEIDGQIRAGLLCTRAGADLTMHVIAHDPAFDDLRLGFLCCVLTIRDAIAHGLQRFHFLWGHYDYKTRLGGQCVVLSQVLLLRSGCHAWRHPQPLATQGRAALRAMMRCYRQRGSTTSR